MTFRSVVLALLLLGCQRGVVAGPTPNENAPSVRRVTVDGEFHCTAWHLDENTWITAGHCCVDLRDEAEIEVGGVPAAVIKVAETDDLCAVSAGFQPRRYRLADDLPWFASRVHYIGYPEDHFGIYEGLFVGDDGEGDGDVMFTALVFGGASGSPLFDSDGRVIGVVVSSYRGRPVSYAEPLDALRAFVRSL